MNNDQKKNDDTFLDEDFDFDEAAGTDDGSFDDFDDAEWDEDVSGEDGDASENRKTPKAAKAARAPKIAPMPGQNRSFFVRYFYLILVTMVVMLGGGFVFLKMGSTPAIAPATDETSVDTAASDFTGGTENLPSVGEESNDLSLGTSSDVNTEFPDAPPSIDKLESDMASAMDEAPPMPAPINSLPEDFEIIAPDQADAKPETPAVEQKTGIETETLTPMFDAPAAAETAETPQAEEAPSAPASAAMSEQTTTAISEQNNKIEQLESKVAQLEKKLSQRMDSTDSKMSDIATTLASMNTKMDSLASRPVAAIKSAPASTPAAQAPAPAARPTIKSLIPNEEPAETTSTRTAPVPAPAASSTPSPRWELRFAQPGKAMLAEKGASDFRTVEVGDTLPGLGKITLIDQVGGRWIVRGTQGTVTQ